MTDTRVVFDYLNNEINIDDTVIYRDNDWAGFAIGKIVKINDNSVRLQKVNNGGKIKEVNRRLPEIIKIDAETAALRIMSGQRVTINPSNGRKVQK